MAKDPAILWYYNDYLSGTEDMTFEEQGAYMRLLCKQADKGPLPIDVIQRTLRESFEKIWPQIKIKFKKNSKGNFYNERVRIEKNKREKFISDQSLRGKKSAQKRWSKDDNHGDNGGYNHGDNRGVTNAIGCNNIINENENINEDVFEKKKGSGKGKTFSTFPNENDLTLTLPEIKNCAAKELFKITKQKDLKAEEIEKFWYVFKAQHFTGKKYYADVGDIYSHFINWVNKQNVSDIEKIRQTNGSFYNAETIQNKSIIELAKKYDKK